MPEWTARLRIAVTLNAGEQIVSPRPFRDNNGNISEDFIVPTIGSSMSSEHRGDMSREHRGDMSRLAPSEDHGGGGHDFRRSGRRSM